MGLSVLKTANPGTITGALSLLQDAELYYLARRDEGTDPFARFVVRSTYIQVRRENESEARRLLQQHLGGESFEEGTFTRRRRVGHTMYGWVVLAVILVCCFVFWVKEILLGR